MKIFLDAYLQKNLGDDLFLYIALNRYKDHDFYTVTSNRTYRNMFKNLHVLDNKYLVKILRKFSLRSFVASKCDLFLTLGGSMFIESPQSNRKRYSLGNKDHYILGINFGPYKTQQYYEKIKNHFVKAKDVCFREQHSYELFSQLPQTRIAPDIAFSLPLEGIPMKNEKHVAFSVLHCKDKVGEQAYDRYLQIMANMVDMFADRGYKVTVMSFCDHEGDPKAIDSVLSMVRNTEKVHTYYYDGDIKGALGVLASSSVVVGGRFHANVIGLLMNKIVIPFVYSDKTRNMLDDLGFQGVVADIRELERFDLKMLDDIALQYRLDVSGAVASAERHFMKLDERLGK